jgi:hypothetical protein
MHTFIRLILVAAVAALVLFVSCSKLDDFSDFDVVSGTAEYAIPLVDTDISLGDILHNFEQNSSLTIDPDGTLRFNYSGDVITQTSEFFFEAIEHTLAQFPIIPITSRRMSLPFSSPGGLALDRIDCKTGTFTYYVTNRHPESVNATITFPDVKKNGQPLRFQMTLPPYSGTGDAPFSTNIFSPASVEGYIIESDIDSVFIEYEAIRASGISDTLASVLVSIQNLTFSYAEGSLSNYQFAGNRDTIEIDFFDNWTRGDVYFEDPTVTFHIENSFGIPTRSLVNVFDIITVNGEILPLQSPHITNGIDFPYPSINEVGQVKTRSFVFNKNNSNIDVVLGSSPVAVDYDISAATAPQSEGTRGFITEDGFYKVRVEVELPLFGRASGFVAQDTFDINLGDLSEVDFAEFKLFTKNELPLEVELQGYFLDENNQVLDSLFQMQQLVVQGAPVNSEGISTSFATKSTLIPFSEERLARIKPARRLLVNTAFSTLNGGANSIKVLAHQNVHIQLGAKLGKKR